MMKIFVALLLFSLALVLSILDWRGNDLLENLLILLLAAFASAMLRRSLQKNKVDILDAGKLQTQTLKEENSQLKAKIKTLELALEKLN